MEIFRMSIERLKEIDDHKSKKIKEATLVSNVPQSMRFAEEHFDKNKKM
jgi:hypothetical protein